MFLSDKININKSSGQDVIHQRISNEFMSGIVEPSTMMRPVVATAAEPGDRQEPTSALLGPTEGTRGPPAGCFSRLD